MPLFRPAKPVVRVGDRVYDQVPHLGIIGSTSGDDVVVSWKDGTAAVETYKVRDLEPDGDVWRVERSWPWRAALAAVVLLGSACGPPARAADDGCLVDQASEYYASHRRSDPEDAMSAILTASRVCDAPLVEAIFAFQAVGEAILEAQEEGGGL